jgi:hypothetical protein
MAAPGIAGNPATLVMAKFEFTTRVMATDCPKTVIAAAMTTKKNTKAVRVLIIPLPQLEIRQNFSSS